MGIFKRKDKILNEGIAKFSSLAGLAKEAIDNNGKIPHFGIIKKRFSKVTDLTKEEHDEIAGTVAASPTVAAGVATLFGETVAFSLAELAVAVAGLPTALIYLGSQKALESNNPLLNVVGAIGVSVSAIPYIAFETIIKTIDTIGDGIIKATSAVFCVASAPLYFLGKGIYKLASLPKYKKLNREVDSLEKKIKEKVLEQFKKDMPGCGDEISVEISQGWNLPGSEKETLRVNVLFNNSKDKVYYEYKFYNDNEKYWQQSANVELNNSEQRTVNNLKNYRNDLKHIYEIIQNNPDEKTFYLTKEKDPSLPSYE